MVLARRSSSWMTLSEKLASGLDTISSAGTSPRNSSVGASGPPSSVCVSSSATFAAGAISGEMVRPMGAVASPDGAYVFISTGRGRNVVIIDTKTNQPVGSIQVGERPWGIAVSPDGKTVFTANGPSNDVSFVDVESRSVKATVKVGDRPWGVVFVP